MRKENILCTMCGHPRYNHSDVFEPNHPCFFKDCDCWDFETSKCRCNICGGRGGTGIDISDFVPCSACEGTGVIEI